MSKPSPFPTYSVPTFSNSPGSHAQLSKMPEMYVTSSSEYIILTYWFLSIHQGDGCKCRWVNI